MKSLASLFFSAALIVALCHSVKAEPSPSPEPVPSATPSPEATPAPEPTPSPEPVPSPTPVPEPEPQPQPAMSDPQIAQLVLTANTAEIFASRTARTGTRNRVILSFARHMISEHTGERKQAVLLFRAQNIVPEDSDASRDFKKKAAELVLSLRRLRNAGFDRSYIASQVELHTKVLESFDKVLIPSAQNAELKAFLEKARSMWASHLELAQKIQAKQRR